jgi:hypothetical protein
VGADDDGERIARLEVRVAQLEAQATDMNRKLWAAVTVILLVVWNKVASALGLGA